MTDDNDNLYARFRSAFDRQLDKVLLETESGQRFTYRDVDRESAKIANGLAGLGVTPGDRVSAQVDKSPLALCLYLACLRGGFVFHPLNPAYRAEELEYFLGNAEPAVVVADPERLDRIEPIVGGQSIPHLLTLDADGSGTLAELARPAAEHQRVVQRASDDMAALLYSSGTTGVPKGIVLTHDNLYRNAQTLTDAWGFTPQDRLLHALPIFHVHGLFVALGCVLLSGAGMRWLPAFEVDQVLRFLPECTSFMGVPTYYTRLLATDALSRDTVRNVRLFVSGSAPLLETTFHEFQARTGHRILERYGMTETNMNTSNPLDGERKPGTVGPPLPGVEVRITDDAGGTLGAGEIGNLEVRGANVFREYWRMPEKTAEDFTGDGFFRTGDLGVIDEDGYVSIVGRDKDMIISGGLNVYPVEIEDVVNRIAGVRESAVIGVPHADFGEAVVAVAVRSDDSDIGEREVIGYAKKTLANFKVPKRVVFVDALPRNTMGKVQKNRLRETYENLFDRPPTV